MWEGPGSSDASVASDVASRCPGEPLLTREVVGLGREGEPGWLSAVAAGRAAGRGAEGTRSRAARFFNAIPQWLSSFFSWIGESRKKPLFDSGSTSERFHPGGDDCRCREEADSRNDERARSSELPQTFLP